MASVEEINNGQEEIISIDTKEDTEDIIEIPLDHPLIVHQLDRPDEPKPIKSDFQCDICLKVLSSKNNLKEIDLFWSLESCGMTAQILR